MDKYGSFRVEVEKKEVNPNDRHDGGPIDGEEHFSVYIDHPRFGHREKRFGRLLMDGTSECPLERAAEYFDNAAGYMRRLKDRLEYEKAENLGAKKQYGDLHGVVFSKQSNA